MRAKPLQRICLLYLASTAHIYTGLHLANTPIYSPIICSCGRQYNGRRLRTVTPLIFGGSLKRLGCLYMKALVCLYRNLQLDFGVCTASNAGLVKMYCSM